MKRTLVCMATIAMLCIGMASCQKEKPMTFVCTITTENNKTHLLPNEQSLRWNSGGESIVIFSQQSHAYDVFTAYSNDIREEGCVADFHQMGDADIHHGPFTAFYPADAFNESTLSFELPQTQMYDATKRIVNIPMIANSDDNHLYFNHVCSVIRLVVKQADVTIRRIVISTGPNEFVSGNVALRTDGTGKPCLVNNETVATAYNSVTLDCGTGVDISDATTFWIYMPVGTYHTMNFSFETTSGQTGVRSLRSGNTISLERSKILHIDLTDKIIDFAPQGAEHGLFSVSPSHQIRFSQGNLQYQASTGTWRFAENQYDYVGNLSKGNVYTGGSKSSNTLIGPNYNGWIDLFAWGTSGANSGASSYQPYATSTNPDDYYPGGNASADLTGSYCQSDWGVHNPIINGGNAAGEWRTLTDGDGGEWDYLLKQRTTATGTAPVVGGVVDARWAEAMVVGVRGLIIFPDSLSWPLGIPTPTTINIPSDNWNNLNYTQTQWHSLETAGCVFLPAGGNRYGAGFCNDGNIGYYWSSSHCNTHSAYCVGFGSAMLYAQYPYDRDYGMSVRLVKEIDN